MPKFSFLTKFSLYVFSSFYVFSLFYFFSFFYGLKLCLKMSKTSGYAQIFIFDQELSAIWITIFMNNPWQPWK